MSGLGVPSVEHLLGIAKLAPAISRATNHHRDGHSGIPPPCEPVSTIRAQSGYVNLLTPGFQYYDVPTANTMMPGLFADTPMTFSMEPPPPQPTAATPSMLTRQADSTKSVDDALFLGSGRSLDNGTNSNFANAVPDEEDMDIENVLSINLLLDFQPVLGTLIGIEPANWDCVDVNMIVVKRFTKYENPRFPFQTAFDAPLGEEKPIIYTAHESTEIPREGTLSSIMQKSIDIVMPNIEEEHPAETYFDINLVFKETSIAPTDWLITSSCYIALQSAKKVLYPVRCNFSRHRVDVTGAKPTFYCSFALKRTTRKQDTLMETVPLVPEIQEELAHLFPKRETISRELSSNPSNDSEGNNDADVDMDIPDKTTLRECSSHGMRPIGPYGRLMTAEQRRIFASIQKRFAKTPCRERKSALLNTDLYPLFTLGRDECCKEMGTCATWLKHRMRERGIKVWPNRRLIPTTSSLYRLKQQRAAILDGNAGPAEANSPMALPGLDQQQKVSEIDKEIAKLREVRIEIVRGCCTSAFFKEFMANSRPTILDPDWEK